MEEPRVSRIFHAINRALSYCENAAMFVVAVALFLVMIVTFINVMFRYILNSPIDWAYGFVSHYLLVATFFLALPYTYRTGRHVRVDAFISRLPTGMRLKLRVIDLLVSLCLFALIFYQSVILAYSAWSGGDVMPAFYNWPSWTSKVFVPIGIGLLEIRLLLTAISTCKEMTHGLREPVADRGYAK